MEETCVLLYASASVRRRLLRFGPTDTVQLRLDPGDPRQLSLELFHQFGDLCCERGGVANVALETGDKFRNVGIEGSNLARVVAAGDGCFALRRLVVFDIS